MDQVGDECALLDFGPARKPRRKSGPATAGGKKTCSQNARKHGCRSKERILPGERRADYDALWRQWLERYEPEDDGEVAQLEAVVDAAWRLRRSEAAYTDVERKLLRVSKDAAEWPAELVGRLQLMQRYRTSAENSLHKAMRMLEFLKGKREASRAKEQRAQAEDEAMLARLEVTHPELAEKRRKSMDAAAASFADYMKNRPRSRAELLFRGQNAVAAHREGPRLEQYAEIRVVDGRTVTELVPSNAELVEQGKAMLPRPELVLRRLNFPDGVPAEYAWVATGRDESQRRRGRGASGWQRMTADVWLELMEREEAADDGHLLPTPQAGRAQQQWGGCDCPACVTRVELELALLRKVG